MNNKIILTVGPSGSGKSTWCHNFIEKHPEFVRVGRDDLRNLLFGYNDRNIHKYYKHNLFNTREQLVTHALIETITCFLNLGFGVLVDNTHLNIKYINNMYAKFHFCDIALKVFDVPLEECLKRDSERIRQVGTIINSQYESFLNLKEKLNNKNYKYFSEE